MNFLILGAGGIGSYFGARLLESGHKVIFAARGKQLIALQQNKLKLQHPEFYFLQKVSCICIDQLKIIDANYIDAVLIATKSTSTKQLASHLQMWLADKKISPYIVSLQNGVDNEEIFSTYLNKEYIIAGLTRKIGAHIVGPAFIKAIGNAETILGAVKETSENKQFLKELQTVFNNAKIPTYLSEDINLELWKKLIINNGVNAICALLRIETKELMTNSKLSKIVYGLMSETAQAAKSKEIYISKEDIDEMFELITKFDSIKPSMLVDVENKRILELEEICGVVIKNLEAQNLDAPYTRTISTILEYTYNKELSNE